MYINEYQKEANKFASYGDNEMYPILGLAEEAGEVAGKVAKFIRKNNGRKPDISSADIIGVKSSWEAECAKFREDIKKELGDVCWMLAEICTNYGLELEDVMFENLMKLEDRMARGVIVGEGDNR